MRKNHPATSVLFQCLKLRNNRPIPQNRLRLAPLKPPHPRQHLLPRNPTPHPSDQNPNANHRVQPIRKTRVTDAARGPQERRHDQETLSDQEEDGYGPPYFEGAWEVGGAPAEDEEADDDDEVDDGVGVAFYVDDEVVCVACFARGEGLSQSYVTL